MRRLFLSLAGALAFILPVLALGTYVLLRMSLPALDGEIELPGLEAEVSVQRDDRGVPTVRAGSRGDLVRAIGFLHAQDRYFQMDLLRRRAAGELSALIGGATVEADRAVRLHRFRDVARASVAQAAGEERELLRAYRDGVNGGLEALGARPAEYLALGVRPEPWREEDTLLAVFAMYLTLGDADASQESRLALMRDALPEGYVHWLTAPGSPWEAPLVGTARRPVPVPGPEIYDLRAKRSLPAAVLAQAPLHEFAADGRFPGSNNWAVSGSRTADGQPLLANDMHLGLSVPNTWYRMRLVIPGTSLTPGADVTGVTLPGAYSVVAGSNGHVAWGFTNTYGDWVDIVLLEPDPGDANRYRTPEGYREYEEHEETIEVKGRDPVTVTIRSTIWGPVMTPDHRGQLRALKWLPHDPRATNGLLAGLAFARDVYAAMDIANTAGVPPNNFVVADATGNIAWTIVGRIPRRVGYDPARPASWAEPGIGWAGYLTPDEYPRVVNPRSGLIWTANARVASGDMLAKIGEGGYALGARAQQIARRLDSLHAATPADMLAVQLDDAALFHERWRTLLLTLLTPAAVAADERRGVLRDLVDSWSGRADVDSAGFRLVRAFRSFCEQTLFTALTAEVRAQYPDFRFAEMRHAERPLWQLVSIRPGHLLPPGYPDWDAQLLAVVDATIEHFESLGGRLADHTWGARNTTRIAHPLSTALPVLSRWLDMPSEPLPGDSMMPRVQSPTFGASERLAVSPGNEAEGYFHMPGGQSGHPLSPYYRAGHEAWARGATMTFLPGQPAHTLRLTPTEPES